ncbi:MAG TPA: hypothetical protein VMW27_15780 [Thermoanaerobaculia bacterium]|nr:hypothetical protein [Thermoanaerobaculia bacterium]
MSETHLSIETLAKLLAGDLDHEVLLREVVPHLIEVCPVCQQRHQEIRRLQKEFNHWDERVAVFEGLQAPELFEAIKDLPFDEQLNRVTDDPSYQTWALCQLLLRESLEAAFEDAGKAMNLADLAISIVQHLTDAYDPHWVLDLQARSYAYLGNARRVLGELRSAETAFRKAESLLASSMTGDSLIAAEILHLKCSLRRDQRRLDEALELAAQALSLYEEHEDLHGVGVVLLKKAKILEEHGQLNAAISVLRDAIARLNISDETELGLYARHNLTLCLSWAGQYEEAERLFSEIRADFERWGKPLDLVRLRWTEGQIACGREIFEAAEAAFREVQQEFLRRGMGYDAALVSLDLAIVYAHQHRLDELKQLALEIVPVFESRDVHREAIAALVMFQQACQEERLTAELARHLSGLLQQGSRSKR